MNEWPGGENVGNLCGVSVRECGVCTCTVHECVRVCSGGRMYGTLRGHMSVHV